MSQTPGLFESVIDNSRDISDSYYNDLALQQQLGDDPANFEDLLAQLRVQMQANGGIKSISAINDGLIAEIEQAHIEGKIAAVDGTDAIRPTEVMSKTVYAVGVISTTAKTLNNPNISMTESHRRIPVLRGNETLLKFIDELDQWVDHDQSWMRTFREYWERQEALRLIEEDGASMVLIDGPLYTQNLLTQPSARTGILSEMQDYADRLIGIIKEMHTSKIMHLAGMALKPDEYWTIASWRGVLSETRFKHDADKQKWLRHTRSDWSRTVYRKGARAFAFECHPNLTEKGVALIASDICCSTVVNHEIPFLLHSADRIVQARVNARAKSDNLINSLPYYANLADERTFR